VKQLVEENDSLTFETFKMLREYLEDSDTDRLYIYRTSLFKIMLFTTSGTPVDPYTAADIVRGVDAAIVDRRTPFGWPRGFDSIKISVNIASSAGSGTGKRVMLKSDMAFMSSQVDNPEDSQIRIDGTIATEVNKFLSRLLRNHTGGIIHIQLVRSRNA
jgi:hypothetical protein